MTEPNPPGDGPTADGVRRRTRRAFLGLAAGGAAAGLGWWWLRAADDADGIPWPLRWTHRFNEAVGRALFSPGNLAPEFAPEAAAAEPRVNGAIGMPAATPAADWRVAVAVPDMPERALSLGELFAGLPRVESVTELKCIEGWSQVVAWSGVRFAAAAERHGWPVAAAGYVAVATPDGGYYVGLDGPSALHPQTLLCDRMNGAPLAEEHGGPLRLVIPVKYGIKNLKWLGRIAVGAERPADYWAERGYDWYAGL